MTQIVTEAKGAEQILTVVAGPEGSPRVLLRTEMASSPDGHDPGRSVSKCVLTGPMVAGLVAWVGGLLPHLERQEQIECRHTVPDGGGHYCRLLVAARRRYFPVEEPGRDPSEWVRRVQYAGELQIELRSVATGELEGVTSIPVGSVAQFLRALRHPQGE
jgi:hypothetical protein